MSTEQTVQKKLSEAFGMAVSYEKKASNDRSLPQDGSVICRLSSTISYNDVKFTVDISASELIELLDSKAVKDALVVAGITITAGLAVYQGSKYVGQLFARK